jgi:HK97 family phage major capsid protein
MLSNWSLPDPYYTTRQFSLGGAIKDLVFKNKVTGYERELSDEAARKIGRRTDGFFMPLRTRATYSTAQASTGGHLVATQLLADSFIDVLRARSVTQALGATLLTGLVGNVSIPRQATATQTYWVTEGDPITQAEATFDHVTMTPKVLGTRSTYTRLMLQQSTPDIETVIRNDLAMGLALELDRVALVGTGTNNQPLGVLNQANIPTHAMGAAGAAFVNSSASANSGIDPLIELEGLVAGSNAPVNSTWGYATNSRVIGSLRKLKTSGDFSYLRDVGPLTSSSSGPIIMGTGLPQAPMRINGYPLFSTNLVPSNLTKSTGTNLSAALFGAWSELLIGLWGALEIVANPYGSDDFARGNVSIRAMLTCDVAVKHVNSFAVIKDIIA